MEKELGKVVFTETENGFRIEVAGKSLKEVLSCCHWPMAVACCQGKTESSSSEASCQ